MIASRIEAEYGDSLRALHYDSYGYRPGRSPLDAIAACRKRCWELGAIFTSDFSAWRSQMVRSRVELFEQIRRDRRIEDLSIRELAERHSVHRRTVRQALDSPLPPPFRPWITGFRGDH